jgi:hypothetical protein
MSLTQRDIAALKQGWETVVEEAEAYFRRVGSAFQKRRRQTPRLFSDSPHSLVIQP